MEMMAMESLTDHQEYNSNEITIKNLNHPANASRFLRDLQIIAANTDDKRIFLKGRPKAFFPNALLPICGMMEHYKSLGYEFVNELSCPNLSLSKFTDPIQMTPEQIRILPNPYNRIFLFDSNDQVDVITQTYVDVLSKSCVCGEGVLDGINWCIAEIMDNVLTHSGSHYGLVMAQIHQSTQHIAFGIYDSGVGIYKTLNSSKHRPRSELDALSIAIQEGTSDGKGQGNGLYGLYQIVKNNMGRLTITSGHSSLMMDGTGEIKHFDHLPYIDDDHCGTLVDFQLDLRKNINMQEAFRTIGGFSGIDMRIDNMLSEEDEMVHYRILEVAQGTATRQSGFGLRTDIKNTFERTKRRIILDFEGIQNVSSSFIDELIAKLVLDFGFVAFNQIFTIINMNQDICYLCNRSLYMRVHEEWQACTSGKQ